MMNPQLVQLQADIGTVFVNPYQVLLLTHDNKLLMALPSLGTSYNPLQLIEPIADVIAKLEGRLK
jgi:hypothetical protein